MNEMCKAADPCKRYRTQVCPECNGNKHTVFKDDDGRLVRIPCEPCLGSGKVRVEIPTKPKKYLETDHPRRCPRCWVDVNPETDNFCWLCGVSLGNRDLRPPTNGKYTSPNDLCGRCGSYGARRLSRWGIFRILPAWRWFWPVRIWMRYSYCHTCGKDNRITMII